MKFGETAVQTAQGVAAAETVFDPHDPNLANIVQSVPALQNPVTLFLSADPKDSD